MAPANKKAKEESVASLDDPTLLAVFKKTLRRDTKWTLVVVAIITGIACGFYIEGAAGVAGGVLVVTSLTTLFIQGWLRVDEDAYGGLVSLMLDSAYVAFAAFLVSWTLTHSVLFGDELKESLNQARITLATAQPPLSAPDKEL